MPGRENASKMQQYVCDICGKVIALNEAYTFTLRPKFKVAHERPVRVELDMCPRCAEGFEKAMNTKDIHDVIRHRQEPADSFDGDK